MGHVRYLGALWLAALSLTLVGVSSAAAVPTIIPNVSLGPPTQAQFGVTDAAGISALVVTLSANADTLIPPFIPGETSLSFTSTRIDQTQGFEVGFNVTEASGATFSFDFLVNANGQLVQGAPEPGTLLLVGSGAVGLGLSACRRKRTPR